MISITISFVISSVFALSRLIALETFIKHKYLILRTLGLATDSHIITDNIQTI